MTGLFMSVKRNGHWCSVEIEYLSEAELYELFENAPKGVVISMVAQLTDYMRNSPIQELTDAKADYHRIHLQYMALKYPATVGAIVGYQPKGPRIDNPNPPPREP